MPIQLEVEYFRFLGGSGHIIGCDVLPDVINSCKITPRYEEFVEKVKPDVLFIISRSVFD